MTWAVASCVFPSPPRGRSGEAVLSGLKVNRGQRWVGGGQAFHLPLKPTLQPSTASLSGDAKHQTQNSPEAQVQNLVQKGARY